MIVSGGARIFRLQKDKNYINLTVPIKQFEEFTVKGVLEKLISFELFASEHDFIGFLSWTAHLHVFGQYTQSALNGGSL